MQYCFLIGSNGFFCGKSNRVHSLPGLSSDPLQTCRYTVELYPERAERICSSFALHLCFPESDYRWESAFLYRDFYCVSGRASEGSPACVQDRFDGSYGLASGLHDHADADGGGAGKKSWLSGKNKSTGP